MAAESIITMKRPGFPKESISSDGKRTIIEYVGEESDLRSAGVYTGQEWGDYDGIVDDAELDPIEGTTKAILTVRMVFAWGTAQYGSETGDEQQTIHEIEWIDVQRSLYEHPEFESLSAEDRVNLRAWEEMPDATKKAEFKFYTGDPGQGDTATDTLSTAAQKLAKGILLGIEYYIDKAPLLRKSTFYVNGPPPQDGGGNKESPGSFPGMPSGYEWVRTADRSAQTGSEKQWRRDQEWTGAKKVLIDSDNTYWT